MKQHRKRWTALGIISLLCVMLAGCGLGSVSVGSDTDYDDADEYTAGDFTYDAADVDTVEIHWVSGEVELVESDASSLSADESGDSLSEEEQVHHWLDSGGTLHIQFCASGESPDVSESDKQLKLEIPKNIDEVSFSATSADLTVEAVTADTLTAEAVDGNIQVDKAVIGDEIYCATVSGDISLGDVQANEFKTETTSGEVEAEQLACADVECSSTSGNIHIGLPNGKGATVEFASTSGDLQTSLSYTEQEDELIFGDGAYEISVETTSGDLEIS